MLSAEVTIVERAGDGRKEQVENRMETGGGKGMDEWRVEIGGEDRR